jgi:hypothetical protein
VTTSDPHIVQNRPARGRRSHAPARVSDYTEKRRKRRNGGALFMNRFVFVALLLFPGTAVLCQSMATPPGTSQAPGKLSAVQWPLDFSYGQPGQTAPRPAFKNFNCQGSNTSPNQASAPIDLDQVFSASCLDLKSHVEPLTHLELFARNEDSSVRSPLVVRPHPKGEPIPKQWPNLKFEQIPTEWPNLKLQLIDGGSSGLAPTQGRAK